MSLCVCSIEFTNRLSGVGEINVGHEGSAGGTAGPVETEGEGLDRADFVEEALIVG